MILKADFPSTITLNEYQDSHTECRKPLVNMVARDRIELPTRGFSAGTVLILPHNIQSLTALALMISHLSASE